MRIAYQGAPGAYSEAAGLKYKSSADTLPCETFEDVFTAVEKQTATHGILPQLVAQFVVITIYCSNMSCQL